METEHTQLTDAASLRQRVEQLRERIRVMQVDLSAKHRELTEVRRELDDVLIAHAALLHPLHSYDTGATRARLNNT